MRGFPICEQERGGLRSLFFENRGEDYLARKKAEQIAYLLRELKTHFPVLRIIIADRPKNSIAEAIM